MIERYKTLALFAFKNKNDTIRTELSFRYETDEQRKTARDAYDNMAKLDGVEMSAFAIYDLRARIDEHATTEQRHRHDEDNPRPMPKGLLGGDIAIADRTGDPK